MTNKRITLQVGDWIKLSDIPNEQVFNLVKQCFTNAGFPSESEWKESTDWDAFYATDGYPSLYSCFVYPSIAGCLRQLSLSDILNSVNGGMDWKGCDYLHILNDGTVRFTIVGCYTVNPIKRIHDTPEAPEAIIPPKTPQWWDYEKGIAVGLPPVDTWCQYSLSNGRTWFKCKVISHDKLVLDCPHVEDENGNGLQIVNKNVVMFRPLDYKTNKQIAVDKALDLAEHNMSFEVYTERLYDAGLLKAI